MRGKVRDRQYNNYYIYINRSIECMVQLTLQEYISPTTTSRAEPVVLWLRPHTSNEIDVARK